MTAFGKVMYSAQKIITKAVSEKWKFRAIDSITSHDKQLSPEDYTKIIDTIVDDIELNEIMLTRNNQSTVVKLQDPGR